MIPLLPKWHLMPNRPSFYDTDSATLLELASTLHSTMNGLIEDYNKLVENVNNTITGFTEASAEKQEQFAIALRQEFQDFINIVELKVGEASAVYDNFANQVNNQITAIDNKTKGDISNFKQIVNDNIENFKEDVNGDIAGMDGKIDDMIAEQVPITVGVINDAIEEGRLVLVQTYNEETESLDIAVTGGV